jgi:AcrR family transcriptional regulator
MPSDTRPDAPPDDDSLVARAVRRRAGDRYAVAEKEVRRILDVGLELMRENPEGDVRIADITRRAEVSNDAFYRAFRSKSDLMAAIADEGSRRLAGYVRHAMGKQADPAERVRAGALAVLAQAVDQEVAATTRAVLRHVSRTQARGFLGVERELADLLVDPLTELGSPDPQADALVTACSLFGCMEHFLWSAAQPTDDQVESVVSWVLRAAGGPR